MENSQSKMLDALRRNAKMIIRTNEIEIAALQSAVRCCCRVTSLAWNQPAKPADLAALTGEKESPRYADSCRASSVIRRRYLPDTDRTGSPILLRDT